MNTILNAPSEFYIVMEWVEKAKSTPKSSAYAGMINNAPLEIIVDALKAYDDRDDEKFNKEIHYLNERFLNHWKSEIIYMKRRNESTYYVPCRMLLLKLNERLAEISNAQVGLNAEQSHIKRQIVEILTELI